MKNLFLSVILLAWVSVAWGFEVVTVEINKEEITNTDNFKKIDAGDLPPAVVESLIKDYPTSTLSQAYKNNQGKYKLIMVLKSGARKTVYIDTYGRWIKMK